MDIKTIVLENTNCYTISTDKSAIIIDPGYKSTLTDNFLLENKDKERLILLTHAHFDHIGDADRLRKKFGVKIAIGLLDNSGLSDNIINEGAGFGINIPPFSADILIQDGQVLTIGDLEIKAYLTQGHTIGGMCYYINGNLFTGDILFNKGFGNTYFHGGDRRKIFNSIIMLFNSFDANTPVFCGHGPSTTIGQEKNYYGR